MRKRAPGKIDPVLERTFGWLRPLGFSATRKSATTVGATFATDAVVIRLNYHWHDEFAYVTIGRRWTPGPGPYWAQVHINELLEHAGMPPSYDGTVRDSRTLETVFARAAALLQEVAPDQLAGRNLELLDEIVAKRPHRGVPGLDFPVPEPWASSQEGLWFTTDFTGPPPRFEDVIEASKSPNATERATAALRLQPGDRAEWRSDATAFGRLVELLADPDLDVRRAAASALSEWRELSVLDAILELLDQETGDVASPFAASATFLAIDQAPGLRQRVREALDRFASRGNAARKQVAELRWRLDDRPPHYPRITQLWR